MATLRNRSNELAYKRMLNTFYLKDGRVYYKDTDASLAVFLSHGFYSFRFRHGQYLLHRLIYLLTYKTMPQVVKHTNGDIKNNHIGNLQAYTFNQLYLIRMYKKRKQLEVSDGQI